MKHTLYLLAVATLLCGCDKSSKVIRDNQELQTRMAALESKMNELQQRNEKAFDDFKLAVISGAATNKMDIAEINRQLAINSNAIEMQQTTISNLVITMNQRDALLFKPAPSAPPPPVQMPPEIMDQIRAGAVQRFPNDAVRQDAAIKEQMDAWYKLNQ